MSKDFSNEQEFLDELQRTNDSLFYTYYGQTCFFLVKLLVLVTFVHTIVNIKSLKGFFYALLFVFVAYLGEEWIFGSYHMSVHSEFDKLQDGGVLKRNKIGFYHHHIRPEVYSEYYNYHRASFFTHFLFISYIGLFFVSNSIMFTTVVAAVSYQVLCHEYYHTRDRDEFYKTERFTDYFTKPNVFDRWIVEKGQDFGIHNRERHRKHHKETTKNSSVDVEIPNEWDELYIFGRAESCIKNGYFNFVNYITDSNETLLFIHALLVYFAVAVFFVVLIYRILPYRKINKDLNIRPLFNAKRFLKGFKQRKSKLKYKRV